MTEESRTETRGRKKGTPKTGGRTLGTPNREIESSKEFLTALLVSNRKKFKTELSKLEGLPFVSKFIELLPYTNS